MTFIGLGASIFVGMLLAEIGIHTFGSTWFLQQLRLIKNVLPAFQQAQDDDERQSLLLKSGLATLQFSILLMLLITVMAVVAMLAPWALVWSAQQQTIYWVTTSVIATGWWFIRPVRSPPPPRSNTQSAEPLVEPNASYGLLDRCLHWLALEPSVARHLAFDLECLFALPHRNKVRVGVNKEADPAAGAVYICGLARSGTTMLLLILEEIEIFRSLTYRDMPFVLAPNLWRLITQHSQLTAVAAERAHSDGIHIHFDSPESFEEVFWRTFGTRNSDQRCLGMAEPTHEALETFANYRALVANSKRQPALAHGRLRRYLSKNNNNLLRLRSLSLDPTATILLVYRNPIDTARSLHRQHGSFCASHEANPFSRTYMAWLGHQEFGLDHLPFCFALAEMDSTLNPADLNYWLDYWIAVHRHILAQTEVRFHLINHDAMRSKPKATLSAIITVLGIDADAATLSQHIAGPASPPDDTGFSAALLERAFATHQALLDSHKNLCLETKSL